MFPVLAEIAGIDPNSVKWINMAPNLQEQMLLQGQVDASAVFSVTSYMNLVAQKLDPERDIRWFHYADHGIDLYSNGVLVSAALRKEHPQAVAGRAEAAAERSCITSCLLLLISARLSGTTRIQRNSAGSDVIGKSRQARDLGQSLTGRHARKHIDFARLALQSFSRQPRDLFRRYDQDARVVSKDGIAGAHGHPTAIDGDVDAPLETLPSAKDR
jgi:hypothetical protein